MAIKFNPNDEAAYFSRGNAYIRKDEIEKAIADYTRAIEINPQYSDAYYNRGTIYGKEKGMHEKAISDFSRAIELNSIDISSYLNRANSYLALGNINEACSDLNMACNLGSCQYIIDARNDGLCQ
jgi:tetratricopeptide (TPR) repeat protein